MAIMITGGTGFLGSYLARHVVEEKGETGVVLYDMYPQPSLVESILDRITIVQGDVLDPHELMSTMRKHSIDRVVHLAFIMGGASRGTPIPPDKLAQYFRVQCMGAVNVFQACLNHGVSRVVYASSVAVHSQTYDREHEYDEDVPPVPDSLYGSCKLWYEHIAESYYLEYGLDIIGMRPTEVFGLGALQRGSRVSPVTAGAARVRQQFVALPELAALGEPVVMPPDDHITDWMYGADAGEAWYCALTAKSPKHRVFNFCSERIRVGDLTAFLRRVLPDSEISVGTEPRQTWPLMDNSRLRNELGFRPRYSMEEGVTHYLNMVRSREGLPPVAPS